MSQSILELIANCQWYPSHFLVISENVFSPLLYYSYLGTAIPALVIGFLILLNGRNRLENRLLFIITALLALWVFCALVTWATEIPKYTMFFWTGTILIEPLISFFAFYFAYVFFFKADFSIRHKVLFSLPLVVTGLLAATKFSLLGFDLTNCDRAAVEGLLVPYDYAIEILYALLIIVAGIVAMRTTTNPTPRKQVLLVMVGILCFLLSFNLGNIVETFTDNWYIGQYGLFGATIFAALLAYVIVRFHAFNIKLLGTQALVWAMILLIGSQFLYQATASGIVVTAFTFLISSIVGFLIVKSVKREVALRESLEIANEKQTSLLHFISHQLKGFFTKTKSIFADFLEGEYGPVSPKGVESAKAGLAFDTEAVDMIQNILGASNLKTGTLHYTFKNVTLNDLVQSLCAQSAADMDRKQLGFAMDITSHPLVISADEIQLTQVFKNLLDNALKYTSSGTVKVTLRPSVFGADSLARFEITDTGVGLSHDDKARLFTEGGKGKDSSVINPDSSGHGLHIIKQIVENHQGRIWAESPGRGLGSTFVVELPLNQ